MTDQLESPFTVYQVKPKAVVDGMSIAFAERTHNGKPQAANLVAIRKSLEKLGYEPIIVVEPDLYDEISDQDKYEELLDDGMIQEIPSSFDFDEELVKMADDYNAKLFSNNIFDLYEDQYPGIENRTIPVNLEDGRAEVSVTHV